MHFLVTGHTGFKGAWLTILLKELGHRVSGLSLEPLPGSLFETGGLSSLLDHDLRVDIRNRDDVLQAFRIVQPEVVIHLAAQPLVLASYEDPIGTYETNVMGTLNVLDALSRTEGVKASLVITTDKVYRNLNRTEGYREDEPLGGDDPYSSSKAMADILTQSWAKSFPSSPIAIARAGNVIGGGDVSADRLLPDILGSISRNENVELRNPDAVRPWQHVLDCVFGYYLLVEKLLSNQIGGVWNFGPGPASFISVATVVEDTQKYLGLTVHWKKVQAMRPEAQLLALNSEKAFRNLAWENQLDYPKSLEWTLDWSISQRNEENPLKITQKQVQQFLRLLHGLEDEEKQFKREQ